LNVLRSKSTSGYDIGQYLKNLLVFSYPSNFTLLIRPQQATTVV